MKKIRLLKVSPETRKTVKQQVLRLHKNGNKGRDIADIVNISEQAASRIVCSYGRKGMSCLKEQTRGCKQGDNKYGIDTPERSISNYLDR